MKIAHTGGSGWYYAGAVIRADQNKEAIAFYNNGFLSQVVPSANVGGWNNDRFIDIVYKSGMVCTSILLRVSACGAALFSGRFYRTV